MDARLMQGRMGEIVEAIEARTDAKYAAEILKIAEACWQTHLQISRSGLWWHAGNPNLRAILQHAYEHAMGMAISPFLAGKDDELCMKMLDDFVPIINAIREDGLLKG